MSHLTLDSSNFEEEVIKSDKPVLVDFFATWCPPCRALGPVIDELADAYKGKAKVAKIDVDQNQELASQFNVMSLPTVVFFKDGKPINGMVGMQPKETYVKELDKLI